MLEMHLNVEKTSSDGGVRFIEELSSSQFASYATVTTLAGVTQGTAINPDEGWLRFDYEGAELIVAKSNIRRNISWDYLNSVGCVFGTKIVTILGNQYKVRLLTGVDTDPTPLNDGYFLEGSHNSEWSRLFYPLVTDDSTINDQYTGPKDLRFTMGQLQMNTSPYSWCQETSSAYPTQRILRGYYGVSRLARNLSSNNFASYGWRPCLELIHSHEAPVIEVASYYNPEDFEMAPSNLHHSFFSDPNTL